MNAYKYSQTGEFVCEIQCQESPREPGKFLIPANATTVAPPEEQAGKARVWNGEEWGYRDDNRGKKMYSVTDSRQTGTMSNVLGTNVPDGWTLTPPPDSDNKYTFVGGQWVKQSVEELRAQLENQLWGNYKAYQRKFVDPEDLTLANTCAAGGSAKGAAVQQWVLALWAQYYTVKDQLAAADTLEALRAVDISTDALTPPPYTIRELNEEAAATLAHGE